MSHHLFVAFLLICSSLNAQQLNIDNLGERIAIADSIIFIDHHRAGRIYDSALVIVQELGSDSLIGKLYAHKAVVARQKGDFDKAIALNLKALEIYEIRQDSHIVATLIHNIGYVFRKLNDFDEALEYYDKALILRKALKDSTQIANSHAEIGVIYRKMKRYDEALQEYKKAQALYNPLTDQRKIRMLNGNLATLYKKMGHYDESLAINLKAIDEIKKSGEKESLCVRYANISSIYKTKKDYNQALLYIDSAIVIADQADLPKELSKNLLSKSKTLAKMKNYEDAYKTHRKYVIVKNELYDREKIEEVASAITAYSYEQQIRSDSIGYLRQQELLLAKNEKLSIQRWSLIGILCVLMSAIVLAFWWLRKRKEILQSKLTNERLSKELIATQLSAKQLENSRLIDEARLKHEYKLSLLQQVDHLLDHSKSISDKKTITSLKREITDQLQHENESSILNKNIDLHPSQFESFLVERFPQLTKSERKMCTLIRSGLSSKEIASVKNTTHDAVRTMRSRIRKKLNIQKGQELKQVLDALVAQLAKSE